MIFERKNGTFHSNEEATVKVTKPGQTLLCEALGRSPTVLPLVMLCDCGLFVCPENKRKQPFQTEKSITCECESEAHVPGVALTTRQSTPANAGGDSFPGWLQPFTEGFVVEPLATDSAGRDPAQDKEPNDDLTGTLMIRSSLYPSCATSMVPPTQLHADSNDWATRVE